MSVATSTAISAHSKNASGLRGHRFFLLFIFLLAALVLYPYAENTGVAYYIFRVLGSAGILLSVYAVSFRRGLVVAGVVLAIPSLLQHLLILRADAGALPLLNVILSFGF